MMSKREVWMRIGIFVFIMIVLRVFLVAGLGTLNDSISSHIVAEDGVVKLPEEMEGDLHPVVSRSMTGDDQAEWRLEIPRASDAYVIINNTVGEHSIWIDGNLLSQNISREDAGYTTGQAFAGFSAWDHGDDEMRISLMGDYASEGSIYISSEDSYLGLIGLRVGIQSVLFTLLIILTVVSFFMWFGNFRATYFLFFGIMGIVSLIKTINMGELRLLYELLGLQGESYGVIDRLTSILNGIWPFFIMLGLFDLKLPRKMLYAYLGFYLILAVDTMFDLTPEFNEVLLAMASILILNTAILLWAFLKKRPYSFLMILSSLLYSSLGIYYFQLLRGYATNGILNFFVNPAYLGAIIYMVGFFLAMLSKHVRHVQTMEEHKDEVERVNLLRGIGHDLKLSLSVIKLNSQIIQKYDLSRDEVVEYANASIEATQELETMVSNMSGYLSLRRNKNEGKAYINECLDSIEKQYGFYNQREGFSFLVEKEELDCSFPIQPIHVIRMLRNLVDNSFKHNPDGVDVVVRCKLDKKIIIEVEDNGMGMERKDVKRIFEPFYRADASRSIAGMGLGMVVVKDVVDSLKGEIEVISDRNRGTVVRVMIPKA